MKTSYFIGGVETYRIEDGKFYKPAPKYECLQEISKEEFISIMEGHLKVFNKGDGIYENYEKLLNMAKEVG